MEAEIKEILNKAVHELETLHEKKTRRIAAIQAEYRDSGQEMPLEERERIDYLNRVLNEIERVIEGVEGVK